MDRASLETAFAATKVKYTNDTNLNCNTVAGPNAALYLSLRRMGWRWTTANTVCDECWGTWDFLVDPPCAIQRVMKRTVRADRLKRISADVPDLTPPEGDVGNCKFNGSVVIDFANVVAPLASGARLKVSKKHWSGSPGTRLRCCLPCQMVSGRRPDVPPSKSGKSWTTGVSSAWPQ